MTVVIDSHTLYWWFEEPRSLSRKGRVLLEDAGPSGTPFFVSPVTFWESRQKQLKGQLESRFSITECPGFPKNFGWVEIVSPDAGVWVLAAELAWEHRDPADRLIAATALKHGVPVLTKDRKCHASDSPVEAVW